jgi:hypothetical protein
MADYMPIILVGGLAVGGFLLYQSGFLNNLFPQPAPAAAAPVSGSVNTSGAVPAVATPCMGSDILTGQPCSCPSTTTGAAGTIVGVGGHRSQSPSRRVRGPNGQILVIPGSTSLGLGSSTTATCDCSKCGGTSPLGTSALGSPFTSSIFGGSPSQFTSVGDLNNFVGSSIAQAGYRLR